MKTPSRDLYDLIRTLDRNEKRYFALYSGGNSTSQYLKLFKALDKPNPPDDNGVRRSLSLNKGSFKKLKHYTQDALLRSLENFHSNSSDDIIISRHLARTEILFKKKSYSLAEKSVYQALEMAKERDRILFILPCYAWLLKISYFSGQAEKGVKLFSAREIKEAAQAGERWLLIHLENLRFWSMIRSANSIGKREKKELRSIIRNCLKALRSGPAGLTIKKEAYITLALATRYTGEWKKSYDWRKKLVDLMESKPALLNPYAPAYIVAIGNLMNACREMGREGEMKNLAEKAAKFIQQLPRRHLTLQVEDRYINLLNSRLIWDFRSGKYRSVLDQGSGLVKNLKRHPEVWGNSMRSLLFQNLMFSAAFTGDHRAATRYYHQWSSLSGSGEVTRRVVNIILLCEAKDYEQVYHRSRSFLSWLERKTSSNAPLKELAKVFMNDFGKVTNERQWKSSLHALQRVNRIYSNSIKLHLDSEIIDLQAWVKTKMSLLER